MDQWRRDRGTLLFLLVVTTKYTAVVNHGRITNRAETGNGGLPLVDITRRSRQ